MDVNRPQLGLRYLAYRPSPASMTRKIPFDAFGSFGLILLYCYENALVVVR
jgi:hypothetical protein